MMRVKDLAETLIGSAFLIGLAIGLIGLFGSVGRSQTASGVPQATAVITEPTLSPTSEPESPATQEPLVTVTPVVTQVAPGEIVALTKHEIVVGPNPVYAPFAQWPVYKDPFYNYTVAYPPEWFLTAPPADVIQRAKSAGAQVVLGLTASIYSHDSSKAPETEVVVVNAQDAIRIDITVDDEPLQPDESLGDFMSRRIFSENQIKAVEETEHKDHAALFVHFQYPAMGSIEVNGLLVLVEAPDSRVFRISASPDPERTVYLDVFETILGSFTILDN